jgi:hypothetical protein
MKGNFRKEEFPRRQPAAGTEKEKIPVGCHRIDLYLHSSSGSQSIQIPGQDVVFRFSDSFAIFKGEISSPIIPLLN